MIGLKFSKNSSLGLFSIILMIIISMTTLNAYFNDFYSPSTIVILLMIIAFLNGLIFDKEIIQSIYQVLLLVELFMIFIFSIIFTFNPWNNATQFPLSSFANIYILVLVIAIFSILIFIFFLLIFIVMIECASIGRLIKQRIKQIISKKDLI